MIATSLPNRALRAPALHFLLIGLGLWFGSLWLASPEVEGPEPVVIPAARIEQMLEDYRRQVGGPPTAAAESRLVEQAVEEELLYREALARGLDRGDRSIAWRLVQKMQFLNGDSAGDPEELHREALELGLDRDDLVVRRILVQKMRLLAKLPGSNREPSEAELDAFFQETREQYRQPARVSLSHLFLSAQKRGPRLAEEAAELRRELAAQGPEQALELGMGDPFPAGQRVKSQSAQQLAKLFGSDFAAAVMALPEAGWSAPVASPYGLHLVWVESREEERIPPLASVRSQVLQRLRAERGEQALGQALQELRERYPVQIEGREPIPGSPG